MFDDSEDDGSGRVFDDSEDDGSGRVFDDSEDDGSGRVFDDSEDDGSGRVFDDSSVEINLDSTCDAKNTNSNEDFEPGSSEVGKIFLI